MKHDNPRMPYRRLGIALALTAAAALQLGCERKPGDGPSTVTPPSNTRTEGVMGAAPGSGASGSPVTQPAPSDSVLVDEGVRGQRLPETGGGATSDPQLMDKLRQEAEQQAQPAAEQQAQQAAEQRTEPASTRPDGQQQAQQAQPVTEQPAGQPQLIPGRVTAPPQSAPAAGQQR